MRKWLFFIIFLLLFLIGGQKVQATDLPSEPGTYPVTITYEENGLTLEKTVYVTVTGPNTQVDEANQVAFDIQSFELKDSEVSSLTKEKILSKTTARAWSTETGENLPINLIDYHEVLPQEGNYPIYFTAGKATTSIPVKVTTDWANPALNSYQNTFSFDKLFWLFLLILTGLLILLLLAPLLLIVLGSRGVVRAINQLVDIFTKKYHG